VGELRKERDEMAAQLKAFNAEVEEANKAAAAAEANAKAASAERGKVAGEASALHAEVARLKVPLPTCLPPPCIQMSSRAHSLAQLMHTCTRSYAFAVLRIPSTCPITIDTTANAVAFSFLARHLSFSHKTHKQTNKPRVSRDCSTG